MRVTARFALLLAAMVLAEPSGWSEGLIPVLRTASESFTNVVVKRVTATHVFFQHAGGLSSVKLSDLPPELEKELVYHPAQADPHALPGATGTNAAGPVASGSMVTTNGRPQAPPGWVSKSYAIGTNGTLTLEFPDLWTDSILPAPTGSPPYVTIRFKRSYEDDFLLQVDMIPPGDRILQPGARAVMTAIGNHALAGAMETNLDLQELKGPEVLGYYFALTDKKLADVAKPKPGAYKYQTQGLVFIDEFGLNFTSVHNYPVSPDTANALEMIRNASFSRLRPIPSSDFSNGGLNSAVARAPVQIQDTNRP